MMQVPCRTVNRTAGARRSPRRFLTAFRRDARRVPEGMVLAPAEREKPRRKSGKVSFLIGSYLLLIVVLPAVLSAVVSYRSLPGGRQCPKCRGETIPLVRRWLRAASRWHPAVSFQRRWCPGCGWEGTVRVSRRAPAPLPPVQPMHTLDLRWVKVNGQPWRVMLQCWHQTGQFYGRLVFIGPTGRLWLDAVEAFSGSTQHEVLGHALSLPDRILTTRLRRLVGDV